jgi:hypothetical protein
MSELDQQFREAFVELDRFISQTGSDALVKLGIESYSINSSGRDYDKGWLDGFHRCLAELERMRVKL